MLKGCVCSSLGPIKAKVMVVAHRTIAKGDAKFTFVKVAVTHWTNAILAAKIHWAINLNWVLIMCLKQGVGSNNHFSTLAMQGFLIGNWWFSFLKPLFYNFCAIVYPIGTKFR